jgi:hypothetical protein
MGTLLAAFMASFCFIGLKALQQRQVVHDEYLLIVPTSMLMAACEVFVVHNIAVTGWTIQLVAVVGLGSGIGCLSAMILHKKYKLNGKKVNTHG